MFEGTDTKFKTVNQFPETFLTNPSKNLLVCDHRNFNSVNQGLDSQVKKSVIRRTRTYIPNLP